MSKKAYGISEELFERCEKAEQELSIILKDFLIKKEVPSFVIDGAAELIKAEVNTAFFKPFNDWREAKKQKKAKDL